MAEPVSLRVNGAERPVDADPATPLLYVLRDHLGLKGTKYGCGVELCGTCSVILDGERAYACTTTLAEAAGRDVVTIEGIGTPEALHPLQKAFLDAHAYQCGYCTPGLIVAAKALLDKTPDPDEEAVRVALQDNLCRCGTHGRIIDAVRQAAREMAP
ncbi:MAG TPA: (2Fe-2S)-binding protein [Alphaproteobacteria bacterium]